MSGLSEEDVQKRIRSGLTNESPKDGGKSPLRILASNLFTLFNALNIALAVCLALVGSWRNMLFLGVVVSNTLIGTVQELRARRTIQKLRLSTVSPLSVLRSGKVQSISPEMLVEGDLVILRRGDQVPADALVREGMCTADESLLTGESDPIEKKPGDEMLSGSYLCEGSVTVQLVRVGRNSYLSRLTQEARKIHQPKSELMSDLRRLVRILTLILLPTGILLFLKQVLYRHVPLERAVPQAVASMIGMIPEGLILLTSIALMVGVIRLGKKGVLVQELFGIETLSRTDMICLDKTGTLTTGKMHLEEMIPLGIPMDAFTEKAVLLLSAFPEDLSPTMQALRSALPEVSGTSPVRSLPFSSSRKLSAASFSDGTMFFGAPSFVLKEEQLQEIREITEQKTALGLRVLVLAQSKDILPESTSDPLPQIHRVLGIICIRDELRQSAPETLRYFRREGVDLRIISGDDPVSVGRIAALAGLPDADRVVDASRLDTQKQLLEASRTAVVFGRTSPEQKRTLVGLLQEEGHQVCMTGDGVNDIPALKVADCSICIQSASDAASHVAQLTLTQGDFSVLPDVVSEGRRVVNNITRAASLFLVKTLYSLFLSLLLLVLPLSYPFQPIQLTLISTFTVGLPSFFLALEPNHERIRGRFLRKILSSALPGAAAVTLACLVCMFLERTGWSHALCATCATLCTGGLCLVNLIWSCLPLNRFRAMVCAGMAACFILACIFLRPLFFLEPLTFMQLLFVFSLIALGVLVMFVIRRLPLMRDEKDAA